MARRITNWAKHYKSLRQQQDQAAAEGQLRPAPSLTPPLNHEQWMDAQTAEIRAREAAAAADTPEEQV